MNLLYDWPTIARCQGLGMKRNSVSHSFSHWQKIPAAYTGTKGAGQLCWFELDFWFYTFILLFLSFIVMLSVHVDLFYKIVFICFLCSIAQPTKKDIGGIYPGREQEV